MPRKELRLKDQLCHPLYSASNALQRIYKKLLTPLEITYPQYLILMALWENDGLNMQAIGEATYFDSGTLSPLVSKLKNQGLIDIRKDPEDLRNRFVFLTKKGKGLEAKAAPVFEKLSCLLAFRAEEFNGFRDRLQELHTELLRIEDNEASPKKNRGSSV